MPIPFLNSIKLNKNQVEDFCVFNYSGDPTLSSGADFGYLWLNTSATPKVLKFWDGTNYRTLIDSTTISSSTAGLATDLAGGGAGQIVYQNAANDTMFLSSGTSGQVLSSNGASAPSWLNQSSLSVGSATTATTATTATNVAGGANGSILVQSGAGTTGQLAIGANGYILTSNGTTPGWSASIPSTSVSGLAASATTDTTNASNISSGTLGLARLSLASGQFYVGDGSNNPAATAKSSIPLSGFGAAGADVAMGGFKITGLADPSAATDAATRGYVDSVAQGLDVKASCKAATVSNINLASPGATIDTVSLSVDNRVLVKDQSLPAENGIYLWKGAAVAMVRSPDADTWDDLVGAFTFIEEGTAANADSGWVCTVNAGGTLGTTAVTWVKFSQAGSYTAGNGIVQSGTSFNFAQSSAYTAGQIPFASSTTAMGFNANLHWDNSNNRLGIGTATPIGKLDIRPDAGFVNACSVAVDTDGSNNPRIRLYRPDGASSTTAYPIHLKNELGSLNILTGSAAVVGSETVTSRLTIASDGVCTWSNVGGVAGTAMTLNGTGLGVGATPAAAIHSAKAPATTTPTGGSATGAGLYVSHGNDPTYGLMVGVGGNGNTWLQSNRSDGNNTQYNILLQPIGGNVGIGTATPGYKLDVAASGATLASAPFAVARITGANSVANDLSLSGPNTSQVRLNFGDPQNSSVGEIGYNHATDSMRFVVNDGQVLKIEPSGVFTWYDGAGGTRMLLNSSGNLGLGVTPSAWVASGYKAAEFGALGNALLGGTNDFYLSCNTYYSSGWKFASANAACYLELTGGQFQFFQSTASPVTGQAISSRQAMTLDASGRLMVNTVTPYAFVTVKQSASYDALTLDSDSATTYTIQNFRINGVQKAQIFCDYADGSMVYRTNTSGSSLSFGTNNTERLRIKSTGQVNFVGQASDPAGASGDVYYNSGSNLFRVYDTGWKTLSRKYVVQLSDASVTVAGNAYTLTHNFASKDVTISIRRTTDDAVVLADVTMPTTNTATVTFASAITAANYYVTVIG